MAVSSFARWAKYLSKQHRPAWRGAVFALYKPDIHYMGTSTNGLMSLRPVTFRYKDDPQAIIQCGLVAESSRSIRS
jgi:hypothetical protein